MRIQCPHCGWRDETEFGYGGEAGIVRPGLDVDDAGWAEYLYFRDNRKGPHAERWYHAHGCGQWFHALRNTATHEFSAFYPISESAPRDTRSGPS